MSLFSGFEFGKSKTIKLKTNEIGGTKDNSQNETLQTIVKELNSRREKVTNKGMNFDLSPEIKNKSKQVEQLIRIIEDKERKRLGLEGQYLSFSFARVFTYTQEELENLYDLNGYYNYLDDSFKINQHRILTINDLIQFLVHENVHRHSKISFEIKNNKLDARRVGYEQGGDFLAFNEGLTQLYATLLLKRYFKDIKRIFPGINYEALINSAKSQQPNALNTVLYLINDIKNYENKKIDEVADGLFKSIFTGEKMWMRILDKIYGPGTNIYLSALGIDLEKTEIAYFKIDDYMDRIKIALDFFENLLKKDPKNTKLLMKFDGYLKKLQNIADFLPEPIISKIEDCLLIIKNKKNTKIIKN